MAGLGAKTVKASAGAAIGIGALVGGTPYMLEYDGTYLVQAGGGGSSTGTGVVIPYTASHGQTMADCGNWLTFTGTGLTFTLASPPVSTTCAVAVQNISASQALTISRNGLTINGVAGDITVPACSGVACQEYAIWTDGSNYFASTAGTAAAPSGTANLVYATPNGVLDLRPFALWCGADLRIQEPPHSRSGKVRIAPER